MKLLTKSSLCQNDRIIIEKFNIRKLFYGLEEKLTNDSVISSVSTTSSCLWREGERILNGEIDLSESMQLCLDGKDPINSASGGLAADPYSSPKDAENIANN